MKSCSQQINLLNSKSKDQGPNISAISANSKEGRSPGHNPGYRPATVNVTLAFLYQQYKTVLSKVAEFSSKPELLPHIISAQQGEREPYGFYVQAPQCI